MSSKPKLSGDNEGKSAFQRFDPAALGIADKVLKPKPLAARLNSGAGNARREST
jgi:hypothetical protein